MAGVGRPGIQRILGLHGGLLLDRGGRHQPGGLPDRHARLRHGTARRPNPGVLALGHGGE